MKVRSPSLVYLIALLIPTYVRLVVSIDDCQESLEHGERIDYENVKCNTGYTKVECKLPEAEDDITSFNCDLDVVSLAVAVALMVFLIILAIAFFSIIIRRYRKTRGRAHGAMYQDSNDYVTHEFGTQNDVQRDGYQRKDKENGDRVIEISIEDAATSNDFKYHEHKDEATIEDSDFASGGYYNDGMYIENSVYEGASTVDYNIDTEAQDKSRIIDIEAEDNEDDETGKNRKSGKSKKNKSSKKGSKVKKSADKSKQKSSTKIKKKQREAQETKKTEQTEEDGLQKRPTTVGDNISADGLYQSMEDLNEEVPKEKTDTDDKLTTADKDVAENKEFQAENESLYAQVNKEHLAMKKLKKQQDSIKGRVANGSPKTYNNLSPNGSDEGYGGEIELATLAV